MFCLRVAQGLYERRAYVPIIISVVKFQQTNKRSRQCSAAVAQTPTADVAIARLDEVIRMYGPVHITF